MGFLQPHGRYGRAHGQADLNRRPILNAFARAQAFGLALGFASALWNTAHFGFGIGLFVIGTAAAWLGWEFLFGRSAPSARSDTRALSYAFASGFVFPWIGFALAAVATLARP